MTRFWNASNGGSKVVQTNEGRLSHFTVLSNALVQFNFKMNHDKLLPSTSEDWHDMLKCSILRCHDKAIWEPGRDLQG